MRKLKLQMQISIDGLVSTGPNDEQHWVTWAWDEIRPYVLSLMDTADTMIIGRKLAVDFIPHWENTLAQTEDPYHPIAQRITAYKKVVFTHSMENSPWKNTTLAKGNLMEEVNKLKDQPGKDILVCGGSSFVSSLIREDLIDEYHFFVNPVAIGKGEGVFNQLSTFRKLVLKNSITYDSGLVLLQYEPV